MSIIKHGIYTIADLITFQRGFPASISQYRILFPARWARYFESDYEQENIRFLSGNCKAGMTVIDIGAHLGLMSVIMAKLVGNTGHVYAFEPTPKTVAIFKDIIKKNKAEQIITPVNKAVSSFDGEMDFFVDEHEGSNANSLVSRPDKQRSAQKIGVTRLDSFVTEKKLKELDLVKIDAEGSELDVLKGAFDTLKQFRPKVILAIHPSLVKNNRQALGTIYDLIQELNYTVYYQAQVLGKAEFAAKPDFFDVHLIPR